MREIALLLLASLMACSDTTAPCNPLTSGPAARCFWLPSSGSYVLTDTLVNGVWVAVQGGQLSVARAGDDAIGNPNGTWSIDNPIRATGTWAASADSLQRTLQIGYGSSALLMSDAANASWVLMPAAQWGVAWYDEQNPRVLAADHIVLAPNDNYTVPPRRGYRFRRQ